MRSFFELVLCVAVGCAIGWFAGVGDAVAQQDQQPSSEDRQRAQEHFEDGAEYFYEQRYGRALVEFRRAYRLNPHPIITYNMAIAHLRIGNLPEAYSAAVETHRKGGLPESETVRNVGRMRGLGVALEAMEVAESIAEADEEVVDEPPIVEEDPGMGAMEWTGIVATALGAGLMAYSGVVNWQLDTQIEAYEQAAAQGDEAEYDRLRSEIDAATMRGRIALYSGAGLAVTGAAMWLLAGAGKGDESSANLGVFPSANEGVAGIVQWSGRF